MARAKKREVTADVERIIAESGAKVLTVRSPVEAPARKPPQARYTRPGDDGMTGIERQFDRELARRKLAGEIHDYRFHAMKLKVVSPVPKTDDADGLKGSWFETDFVVYENDGTVAVYETKGYLDRAGDGWLKFKAAASQYPFAFHFVQKGSKAEGGWKIIRHR